MSDPPPAIAAVVLAATARLALAHPGRLVALGLLPGAARLAFLASVVGSSTLGWIADTTVWRLYAFTERFWPAVLAVQLAAATAGVLAVLGGAPFRLGRALGAGLRRLPLVPFLILLAVLSWSLGGADVTVAGGAALGLVLVALPPSVGERAGTVRALGRAVTLTRGVRLQVATAVALLAAVAIGAGRAWSDLARHLTAADPSWGAYLDSAWIAPLLAPLPAVGASVAYAELRARRDGRRLGRVFE